MKFSKLILNAIALCGTLHLSALDVGNTLNVSGGYSNDVISAHNTITTPDEVTSVDHFRVNNLNIGKIGFDFRLSSAGVDFCCEYPFVNNFYLVGNGYWGWSGKDHFERNITTELSDGTALEVDASHGNVRARTQDFQIGLGYLVWNCDDWAVGVNGGYAYDMQRVRTGNGKTSIDSGAFDSDPLYSGLVYKQKWQGAFVGAEFFYNCCDWLIDVGYEYHFAHYRANFNIPSNPIAQASDFSDVRKGHHGSGNVAYINAHQKICCDIDLGLAFIYKNFRVNHCHLHPRDGAFEEGTDASATAKWINYSIVADIGYAF